MKSIIIVAVLASVLSLAYADCGFSAQVCSHLEQTARSLGNAVETSNEALADAITEAAQKSAALYQASLSILKSTALSPKATTIEDVIALQERLDATLQEAQASQQGILDDAAQAFEEASHEIQHLLEETILSTRDPKSEVTQEVAFSFGGDGLEALKKQLKEALKVAEGRLKAIVQKALDKVNGGISKLEGFLAKILGEAGVQKVRELLKMQVDRILKALADALAKKVTEASKPAFSLAVTEAEAFIDELESDSKIVKRAWKDIWGKVKAAAGKLGGSIRDAVNKALAKHKPIILQKLKELGKAVIDAGKDIVIEIVNGVVKVTVPEY